MNKTFQSFVFGCRVNEAERIRLDRELIEAGFSVDLNSPSFLLINTCAITGKAEREAKQLIHRLRKQYPEAKIVLTGCSATLWEKYKTGDNKIVDIIVPNNQKSSLINQLTSIYPHLVPHELAGPINDKFRYSNRLLVKIQDGCHKFCSYCIVPYLRGQPQSQKIKEIISYINSFTDTPSEVVLSAINTESFGKDTGETLVELIRQVLSLTKVPRIAFGSIHPWTLTEEFIEYYRDTLSHEKRFIHFFHVPIQSGSQQIITFMKRDYKLTDVINKLTAVQTINPTALIATDVIVGFLGETEALFQESYSLLEKSTISRFHVFRFSNRPHTAAYYLKDKLMEPTAQEKKVRSDKLIALSKRKYQSFIETQLNTQSEALVIASVKQGTKILLNNHVEGILNQKNCLPGQLVHATIRTAKNGVLLCDIS